MAVLAVIEGGSDDEDRCEGQAELPQSRRGHFPLLFSGGCNHGVRYLAYGFLASPDRLSPPVPLCCSYIYFLGKELIHVTASLKLSSRLPDGDRNGLDLLIPALVASPDATHAVLLLVDCKSVTTDTDTGASVPTIRPLRAEVIRPEDLAAAEKLIRRALEARTGHTTLPLDLEDEISAVFGRIIDPATGKLIDTGTGEVLDDGKDSEATGEKDGGDQ